MKEHNDEKVAVIPFLKCFSGLVGAFPPEGGHIHDVHGGPHASAGEGI